MKSWRYSKEFPKGKIFDSEEIESLGKEWVDDPTKINFAESEESTEEPKKRGRPPVQKDADE